MLIQEIDDYAFHLATILQYFKQQADAQNKPAEVPISALSNFMDKRGLDINPDTLKSLMTTDPVIKNLIKSKFIALTHSCTAALEISAILINLKKPIMA